MLDLVRLTIEATHLAHCGKKIPAMVQTNFKEANISVSIPNKVKLTFQNLTNVNSSWRLLRKVPNKLVVVMHLL
jgi:hypothetical protein